MRTIKFAVLLGFTATFVGCASPDGGETTDSAAPPAAAVDTSAAAASAAPAPTTGGAVFTDPNSAPLTELTSISGIDSATAASIIAGRPYADMVAVDKKLAKLNEAKRDTVYWRLWKPIDPNKATRAEILLIPGVGDKLAKEFEEYRPWTSVEQFRREIGKYVDAAEVARLEKYIRIQQP